MEEQNKISVSFLTTGEDYRHFRRESARLSVSPQLQRFFRACGIVLLLIGSAGAIFLSRNTMNYVIWGFCLLAGLFFSFYYTLVEPFLIDQRAVREYERIKGKLSAQTIELTETAVHIQNPRANGTYPYEILWRVVRTDAFFLIFIGQGELHAMPMRLLQPEQIEAAATLLQEKLGERYEDRTTR